MIKERYCSSEVSKLLKEKGFNEKTNRYYNAQFNECRTVSDTFMMPFNNEDFMKGVMMEGAMAIPTHQMACDWLREWYNIDIIIEITNPSAKPRKYYVVIWDNDNNSYILDLFGSPKEAIEEALKYCLENLI